jgi:hypothetical protein
MSRSTGIVKGLCAVPPGIAVAITFAAGVNLYYDFHPVFFIGTAIALGLTWFFGRASLRAFGVGPRAAFAAPIALTLAWTGAFFVLHWSTFPGSSAAARKNDVVLGATPVYPGLSLLRQSTNSHYEDDMVEEGFLTPPNFETTWMWSARGGASTRDVADWYVDRLQRERWSVQRGSAGDWIILSAHQGGTNIELDVRPSQVSVDAGTSIVAEVDATTGF